MLINIFLLILFLCAQGFYSGMETGLVSLRRPRVENAAEKGILSAQLLLFFMNNPGLMISTTLLGVNISVVCASLAAKSLFEKIGLDTPLKLLLGTAILSIIMLTCEIIPKNWFRESPFNRCSAFVRILFLTYSVLFLPARIFDKITSLLSKLLEKNSSAKLESTRMREELQLFFRESETCGKIPPEAAVVLNNAVSFHNQPIRNFMVPAEKVPFLTSKNTVQDAFNLCREKNVIQIPISYNDSIDGWYAVFSLPSAIFSFEEKDWAKIKVTEVYDMPLKVSANADILECIQNARQGKSPMFFIEENGRIIGTVSLFSLTRKIFTAD